MSENNIYPKDICPLKSTLWIQSNSVEVPTEFFMALEERIHKCIQKSKEQRRT